MLAGVIVYFLFVLALIVTDMVLVKLACAKKTPFVKSNILRYLRGVEMIAGMFLLTIMELVVYSADLITIGFVHNTTLIYGIVCIIFLAEFAYNEIKLKDYYFVLSRICVKAYIKQDIHQLVKVRMQDTYVLKSSLPELQEELAEEKVDARGLKRQFNVKLGMLVFVVIALIVSIIALTMGGSSGK